MGAGGGFGGGGAKLLIGLAWPEEFASLNATQQVVNWSGTPLVAYSWLVQIVVGSVGSRHVAL
jgi:hypothetical protein